MGSILTLAKQFINLGITGSITPAGVIMAIALLLWTADSTSESPARTLLYRFSAYTEITQELADLDHDRRRAIRRLRRAQRRVQVAAGFQQGTQAARDNATELRNHVRGVYLDRWQRRHGLREEAEGRLAEYQREVELLDGDLASDTRRAAQAVANEAMHRARVDSLNADIDALRDQHLALAPIAFGRLFSTALSILVFGWLIGIVLNPVNKLLLAPFVRVAKPPNQDPLYLIGKNVITQEDYDYLVRNYHRFAQIAGSLVLPVLALGLVLCRWSESGQWYHWSPIIAIVAAALLWVLAWRRYKEFQDRVRRFINGRLCFIEEQRQEAKRKERKNNLVALAKTINEASRLLKLARSCDCTTCKPKPDSCRALGDVIEELTKLLERAHLCCTAECKAALDSCGDALSEAVKKAKGFLDGERRCPKCKSTLDCCDSALGDVEAKAQELRELAEKCCCSQCPPAQTETGTSGGAGPTGGTDTSGPSRESEAGGSGSDTSGGDAPPAHPANPATPARPATPGQAGPSDEQP